MTRSLDELMHYMPVFARRATNEWSSGFARSILRQARKPEWRPSAKQHAIMNRMVETLFTLVDDYDVIEDDPS